MKSIVFHNLSAEQARRGWNDSDVAAKIGITRSCYTQKKARGNFRTDECIALCKLFDCGIEYLFEKRKEV
jgi:DNA-binding XRE family transcriptional regulator